MVILNKRDRYMSLISRFSYNLKTFLEESEDNDIIT